MRRADDGDGAVRLASLAGHLPVSGPAVLLGHDLSAPDLERWTPWTARGRVAGGTLAVEEAPARTAGTAAQPGNG
ncbi:hypothetical protein [Micromonospora nigra]|uniref:hypothetical protein n=1 Tax=Micromonospora nigra TaxID=145857 RepID=UPI000B8105A6|nr:hypothetical protein [Micromonospora nigra]